MYTVKARDAQQDTATTQYAKLTIINLIIIFFFFVIAFLKYF